jgi:hypothetical protein
MGIFAKAAFAAIMTLVMAASGQAAAMSAAEALKELSVAPAKPGVLSSVDLNKTIDLVVVAKSAEGLAAMAGQPLALFFNGREIKGQTATLYPKGDETLASFHLSRTAENKAVWDALLTGRKSWMAGTLDDVAASIGPPGGSAVPSGRLVKLVVFSEGWIIGGVSTTLLLLGLIILLGRQTALLRDPLPAEARGATGISAIDSPFSLARMQLALWLAVTLGGYLFLLAVTGDMGSFSPDALVLMGAASLTTLGAAVVDGNKAAGKQVDRAAARAAYDQSGRGADDKAALLGGTTRGWFLDILSDSNGVNLHRLQMVVWTVVLIGVYFYEVVSHLAMPGFGATLLGLMGVSNGVYLGLKMPE